MKVKNLVVVFSLILLVAVGLFLFLMISPVVTKMPSTLKERPVFLFDLKVDSKNSLKQPMGVAVSSKDKIYIADTGNREVKIFSSNGRYISAFGKKGSKQGEFEYPYGIVALPSGNLLVADTINFNVQEFDQSGKYIKSWITPKNKIKPGSMTIGENGRIYISDLKNHKVVIVNPKGGIEKRIDSKPEGLLYPQGLSIDKKDLLWVADSGHLAIKQLDDQGVMKNVIWGVNESLPFSMVRGVAVDNLGRIFVSDTLNGTVSVFNNKRVALFPLNGQFSYPMGIYIAENGRIYIIDRGNNQIQVWGYKK